MNCNRNKTSKVESLRQFNATPAVAGAMSLVCLRRKFFRPMSGMGGAADEGRERNNMKNKTILTTLGLAMTLALPVIVLSAQDSAPSAPGGQRPAFQERGGPGGQGQRPPPSPVIEALDANHDGVIDADEIANAPAALKKLDKNGDGKLTQDELRPPRPDGGPGQNPPGGPQNN